MVGWHHQFNGHELGQTPGDAEGQGGLGHCSSWARKELDMTWGLNNNNIPFHVYITSSLSIHPLMGHLGCFHILVLLNDAAVTEECKYLFKISISILLELLVYMVVLIFSIFEETLNCFT